MSCTSTYLAMHNNIPEKVITELDRQLATEWSELCAHFLSAQQQKPTERLKYFGELFERLQPWLEHSIGNVSTDNYLLISVESIVSYLFILLLNRHQLPPANCVFHLWVESLALSRANKIIEYGAKFQGCPGEAPLEIQQRFNGLTKRQREIFYLYIVESGQLKEVSRAVGVSPYEIHCQIPKLWDAVGANDSIAPYGWRRANDR